jgi:hypothetical protein
MYMMLISGAYDVRDVKLCDYSLLRSSRERF